VAQCNKTPSTLSLCLSLVSVSDSCSSLFTLCRVDLIVFLITMSFSSSFGVHFPPELLGDYEPVRLLGRGGYGEAVLAKVKGRALKESGHDLVVIKVVNLRGLSSKKVSMAINEAHTLARLTHPLITTYLHCFFSSTFFYIVTEYAEKGDLRAFVQQHARETRTYLKEGVVLDLFIQITLALQYVHSRNIIHRDIKTANIFLKDGLAVKLGDFGICHALHPDLDYATTVIGTPAYVAPEICKREK